MFQLKRQQKTGGGSPMARSLSAKSPKHKLSLGKRMLRCWQLYLFLLIPVVWVVIFNYIPMAGVQIAFRKFNFRAGIWNSPWVGFDQFKKFFSSYMLARILPNTILLSFYGLIAGFPLPIIFALCLNALNVRWFKKSVQTITYIPHFISTVVMVGILMRLFNPRTGLYASLSVLFTGSNPSDIFAIASAFRHLYVWSGVWQGLGWGSIIYLAALSGVSIELHDAAQIDGASRFQRVIHVDLPCIVPTITIMLILNSGSIMSVGFEKVFLLQNDLNLINSEVISTYVYKVGLSGSGVSDYSYSTAISLFNSLVNMTMLVVVNWVSKKVSETSLW
jgi:putative aldouronate transport system permease protein